MKGVISIEEMQRSWSNMLHILEWIVENHPEILEEYVSCKDR